ncbi:MAG: iron complex transport system substrate-binding protein [Actinomycetota bacterium]|jgi:iron complex transport system substrate-binding protein|nr:iron complex transport system substrate-binding protein [Actinomycetota bacterium]
MSDAATSLTPRTSLISRVVMVLAAAFMLVALVSPQAEAAKQKRVVAISPFAAAAMVKIGVKPIAIGQTIGGERRKPAALRGVPVLKLSHPNGPNLEVMAKLRPDVVFSSSRWARGSQAMRRLGITVVNTDPLNINQVYAGVKKVARFIGKGRRAARVNNSIRNRIRIATRNITKRPRVLVVLGIGNTAMAFLGNSWGGELVTKAGGNLVTGGASNTGGFARLSDEVVVAENPDVIVAVPHGNADDLSEVAEYIMNNEAWQTTNAVKNGKVFVSTDNELLQAGTDVGQIIGKIRSDWLKNW